MINKKAKSGAAAKKSAAKKSATKSKKEMSPADVRKKVSKMVESKAVKMTKAVIGKGENAELAAVKYLFEVAAIYPPQTDHDSATAEEDCLAKTLLHRLNIPDEPIVHDEDDEAKAEIPSAKPAAKPTVDGEAKGKDSGSQSEGGEESEDSVLV